MIIVGRKLLLAVFVVIVAGASVYAVVDDDSSQRDQLASRSGKPVDRSQSRSTAFFKDDL